MSPYSYTQANVEKFEIIDDNHFKLHFKAPDGNYTPNTLQLWAIPKKYFKEVGEEGFAKAPVGTGPWKFVSRSIKEDLKLEAFGGYWNKDARPRSRTWS
nr:ABC transporter substrate-binding protein [Bradyrhizobium sp. CCBAU 11386]